MPVPTPVPATSVPAYPAPETAPPASQQPSTPPVAPPPTQPEYHDPLETPITLRSAPPPDTPAAAPAAVSLPSSQTVASLPSRPAYDYSPLVVDHPDHLGSTYIPVDSPVYPMALRLYSMGYLNTAFINMRPWTRRSLLHALDESADDIQADGNEEAEMILARLQRELAAEVPGKGLTRGTVYGLETGYTRLLGITGTPLRDSYHLGQTIINDYGRPYAEGFNNVTGFSTVNEKGRFSLYVRGEFEHAPAGDSYSLALASALSCLDEICPFTAPNNPQDTIPYGSTVRARDTFRLQEATLSAHLLGHELSLGKSDAWLGPGVGGAFAWTNNAENIYSFRINRVEPMHIPLVSKILGPLRYDFFVGSLKGHTYPNSPWVHSEMFAFRPSSNFEFGFQRTIIWGGKNHEAVTLHTFLRSFFDINDTTADEKNSNLDPGARFTEFNFSYRLPFVRRYATLYMDSEAHDDVTPMSAPRRAAFRPGIFLTQLPHLPKMDFRVEAATTDPPVLRSLNGQFNYYEIIQRQGYTNHGFIMGDWIGREAKGGQAWLTYHLSADEFVQLSYLNKKTPKDFIPNGTTQNQFRVDVSKNLGHDLTVNGWLQYERWKAPIYKTGAQNDTSIAVQFTWHPGLKTAPGTK